MPRLRHLPLLFVALAAACAKEPPASPYGPDVALVVDGEVILKAEIERYAPVHSTTAPELGTRTVSRYLLENYVLPLRFAERDFGARRKELLAQAEGLVSVATNAIELEQRCGVFFHQRKAVNRRQVEAPLAEFAFDRELTGSVSKPLAVPRGYVVVACFDIQESAVVTEDLADLLQVGFLTHSNAEWTDWLRGLQERLADKLVYVHPDYRESLPSWMRLP